MTHKVTRAVAPIRQHNKSLQLFVNSYYDFHNRLIVKELRTGRERMYDLAAPEMEISFQNAGEYVLLTCDERTGRYSTRIKVTVHGESAADVLDKITMYYGLRGETLLTALKKLKKYLRDEPETDLLRFMLEQELPMSLDLVSLLAGIQNYYNFHSKDMNADNCCWLEVGNTLPYSIAVSPTIRKLVLRNQSAAQKPITVFNENGGRIYPALLDGCLYEIACYDERQYHVGTYHLYSPEAKWKAKMWETQKQRIEDYNEILQQEIYLPAAYMAVTGEAERQALLLRNKLAPLYCLLNAPRVERKDGLLVIAVDEYDAAAFSVEGIVLYIKAPDAAAGSNYNVKRPLQQSVSEIKIKAELLNEEMYFVYLCDENERILSDISIINLASDDLNALNRAKRRIDLCEYGKTLLAAAEDAQAELRKVVQGMLSTAENDENYDRYNFMYEVLDLLPGNKKNLLMDVIRLIQYNSLLHADEAFEQYPLIKYRKYDRTLIFPPSEKGILLKVTAYDLDKRVCRTNYQATRFNSAQMQRADARLYTVQVIEQSGMRLAGCLAVDLSEPAKFYGWNTKLELI